MMGETSLGSASRAPGFSEEVGGPASASSPARDEITYLLALAIDFFSKEADQSSRSPTCLDLVGSGH